MSEAGVDELEHATGPWLAASLDDALTRLDRALLAARVGGVSFDVGTPEPERELMSALASLGPRSTSSDPSGSEPVSFAADQAEHEHAAVRRVASGLDRLLERASTAARVETRVKDRLVASTRVGLGGDVISSIGSSASPAELALHSSALDQTLQAHRARMRLVISTLQAAAKIAFAIGTANPLAALPAAWQFIRGVIAEWNGIAEWNSSP